MQIADTIKSMTREELEYELNQMEGITEQFRYRRQPNAWVEEKLNETLWSKQVEIMESVRDNRRTAVPSCFDAGKSFIAARLAAWWIDSHPPGKAGVVSTASRFAQVRAILWRELRRAHAKGKLIGRVNQTEWHVPVMYDGKAEEELVAYGRKPDDEDETGFHGFHGRWMLGLIDEASGVSRTLCNSIENLIANEDSRLCAIGNPEDPTSEFKDMCSPGSGWNVIQIKAWDTPNFTGEDTISEEVKKELISKIWVEEKKRKWGERSFMYISNVEAEFPENTTDGLIPISWVRAAQARSLEPGLNPIKKLGVDVGGGSDKSTIGFRNGPIFRIVHKDQNPDTMQTCGEVVSHQRDLQTTDANIDSIGIGKGVADRGNELSDSGDAPGQYHGVNVAQRANDPERFLNLRSEAAWGLRERFEEGNIDIDPEDEDLAAQLIEIRWKKTSSGKIQLESKEDYIKRLRSKGSTESAHSPDEFDCCMLAYAELPEGPKKVKGAIWGAAA